MSALHKFLCGYFLIGLVVSGLLSGAESNYCPKDVTVDQIGWLTLVWPTVFIGLVTYRGHGGNIECAKP